MPGRELLSVVLRQEPELQDQRVSVGGVEGRNVVGEQRRDQRGVARGQVSGLEQQQVRDCGQGGLHLRLSEDVHEGELQHLARQQRGELEHQVHLIVRVTHSGGVRGVAVHVRTPVVGPIPVLIGQHTRRGSNQSI